MRIVVLYCIFVHEWATRRSCSCAYFSVTWLILYGIDRFIEKRCLACMLGTWIQGFLSASLKMNFVFLELFEGAVYLTSCLMSYLF